jgi:alpha-tubulin suppressor-like RCC1 family protein
MPRLGTFRGRLRSVQRIVDCSSQCTSRRFSSHSSSSNTHEKSRFFESFARFRSTKYTLSTLAAITTLTTTSALWGTSAALCDGPKSQIYTWGFNQYGQLGLGDEENAGTPTMIDSLPDTLEISDISCGIDQTAILSRSGQLFTWGRGQDARLGHGSSGGVNETAPRLVDELSGKRVVSVSNGFMHMACVTDDGAVYTWGKGTYSQLGHDGKGEYPQRVESLLENGVKCVKVACGRYHTVALTDDGKCYAWGGYKSGETGTGHKKTCRSPSPVIDLPSDDPVVDVVCGQAFTMFLTKKGSVYSCGSNDQGQTGHGGARERYQLTPTKIMKLTNIVSLAAGHFHSIAVNNEGEVFAWGRNREGQLGVGDTQNRTTPVKIASFSAPAGCKVAKVAAGGGHSAIVCEKTSRSGRPKLFLFGQGRHGQIGRGDRVESMAAYRAEPVEVDYFDSIDDCQVATVALGGKHSAVLCL